MVTLYSWSDILQSDVAGAVDCINLTPLQDGKYGVQLVTTRPALPDYARVTDHVTLWSVDTLNGAFGETRPLPLDGAGISYHFDLASLTKGGLVQATQGVSTLSGSVYTFFQILSSTGETTGAALAIGSDIVGGTIDPHVTAGPGGGFVLGWTQHDAAHPEDGQEARFQTFNATGQATQIAVTRGGQGDQSAMDLAVLSDGHLAAAWLDLRSGNYRLMAEVMATDGTTVSGTLALDGESFVNLSDPQVTALQDGGFLVTWQEDTTSPDDKTTTQNLMMQVFNADGTSRMDRAALLSVTADTATDTDSYLGRHFETALTDGRFAIGWTQMSNDLGGPMSSYFMLMIFDANGQTDSPLYTLGENDGLVAGGGLATLSDGRLVAGWIHDGTAETQIFDSRDTAIHLVGTGLNNTFVGTSFNDTLAGVAGDDSVAGGAGADRIGGGKGDDWLYGETGADRLEGGLGNDVLYGGTGADRLHGGAGNDYLDGEGGRDVFVFGPAGGQDRINGFANRHDRLDLQAFHFADYAEARSHFTDIDGGVLFALGPDSIEIGGLRLDQLDQSDLILA